MTLQPVTIKNHEVCLFFPFYFAVESPGPLLAVFTNQIKTTTTASVTTHSPTIWYNGTQPVYDGKPSPLWQQQDCDPSVELYDHVAGVLNNVQPLIRRNKRSYSVDPDLKRYCLTPAGKALVTGGRGTRRGRGLFAEISKVSRSRLASKGVNATVSADSLEKMLPHGETLTHEYWVQALIKDIELYLFGTGVGLAAIRLSYAGSPTTMTTDTLIESNYAITRIGARSLSLRWRPLSTGTDENNQPSSTREQANRSADNSGFGWQDYFESLLPGVTSLYAESVFRYDAMRQGKLYAYTVLNLNDTVTDEDAKALVWRCASQVSLHYDPPPEHGALQYAQPFGNILHGATTEGACTLLNPQESDPEFTRNFISNQYHKSYLPLSILAYHEFLTVLRMSQGMVSDISAERESTIVARLLQFQFKQLSFRLNYRFDSVSHYSQHNQFYQVFRNAFQMNQLLEEVAADNNEVSAYLELLKGKDEARSQRFWAALGLLVAVPLVVTELTGITLLEALQKAGLTQFYTQLGLQKFLPKEHAWLTLYAVAGSVAVVAFLWSFYRTRREKL